MSREQFYKENGRYPVTKADTEILDIGGDDSDEEISKLVQLTCDLDTAPDTPQGLRSPVTVDKIEQNIYKWYKDKQQEREDNEQDELFREQIRAYWDSKKKEEEQRERKKSNASKGGRTRRNRRIKPSLRRKRTYVFRRKSIKRQNRHSSSRRK